MFGSEEPLTEGGGADSTITEEDECVVCFFAKATMQTFPCGHQVGCRKCFAQVIEMAVSQHCGPMKCDVCHSRVTKLRQILEEPLTPQTHRKQQHQGFLTPTTASKLPKHSSLRQFLAISSKQRASSASPAEMRHRSAGGQSVGNPC